MTMQTIRHHRILSRAAANDPRIERATYHREPEWFEPHVRSAGDRAVSIVLAAVIGGLIVLALSERYGADLIAGVL